MNLNRIVLVFAAVFGALWLWNLVRKALAVRGAARRILTSLRETFAAEHELRTVDELSDEARAPLDTMAAALAPFGLQRVCDFEDADISRGAGLTIPMRAFASTSEPIGALAYHHPQLGRTLLDVITKLSNGHVLTTTTAIEATKLTNPPELERRALPAETTPSEAIASHRQWLQQALAAAPTASATAASTPEDVLADGRLVQRLKHEHRKRIGWVTFEEMVAMARGREDVARVTYAAIQRELARHAGER